jgi:hypothetical protein
MAAESKNKTIPENCKDVVDTEENRPAKPLDATVSDEKISKDEKSPSDATASDDSKVSKDEKMPAGDNQKEALERPKVTHPLPKTSCQCNRSWNIGRPRLCRVISLPPTPPDLSLPLLNFLLVFFLLLDLFSVMSS